MTPLSFYLLNYCTYVSFLFLVQYNILKYFKYKQYKVDNLPSMV